MKISKQRLEAFSDGIIAIIITIMILNIPLPNTFTIDAVAGLLNSIFVYFVTFFVVAAQWNKHHYLFTLFEKVNDKVVWINFIFLFFLSLMPIFTKWVIQNPDEVIPAVGYDVVFILVNVSFQFMFKYAAHDMIHNRIKELKNRGNFSWFHVIGVILVFLAILTLSIYYPRLSIVFFIVVPIASSLSNLIFENRNI